MYVVILAGGVGTRLWPRSRRRTPKQLLDLVDEQTMLQRTVTRVQPLLPNERIFVSTGEEYASQVREQLPFLPVENIIVEPEGKGTAPCAGLAAVYLERHGADDVIAMLHADAYIGDEERFRQVLLAAVEAAQRNHLVTIGITPRYAETGFGYIQRDELLTYLNGQPVYSVKRFTEKPKAADAEAFVASGEYYWNSGMFAWKISRILEEMERCLPRLYAQLREIQRHLGGNDEATSLRNIWQQVESQSIDVGVMEKARDVVVIPADIGWSDIGSWAALAEVLTPDADGNVVRGLGRHLGIETTDSFIYSPHRLVATIGLEGMVVIDTEDALLICPKERSQEVKALVERLKKEGLERYC